MPVRQRSRAALSRLPRWVTALGIAALAGELTFAALLAAGSHRPPRARGAMPTAPAAQGATPTAPASQVETPRAPGAPGATQTVLLHVDGVPLRGRRRARTAGRKRRVRTAGCKQSSSR